MDKKLALKSSTPMCDLDDAFIALQNSLRNYLRRHVDAVVVDDLLQDIFEKAVRTICTKEAPKNLPGWLYSVARTTVIDHYRKKSFPVESLENDIPEFNEEKNLLEQELAGCLRLLVRQLPEKYGSTLVATDFEGRTMRDVANELGLSVSAIKSRASRARIMLKEKLLDCCRIEFSQGKIEDYQCQSTNSCKRNCI